MLQPTDRELAQCRFEVSLARRLRVANRRERMTLYGEVYNAYYDEYPESLPQDAHKARSTCYEVAFARKFVSESSTVAELGPGHCELSLALAPHVRKIYAIDVTPYLRDESRPRNFEFKLCDGLHYPLPDNAVDVVLSNELIEHLHPDDAVDQVAEVHRILKPGGRFLCGTPNRIGGPHDCSNIAPDLPCEVRDRMFVANGLHLQEYTNRSLSDLLSRHGFRQITPFIGMRGRYFAVPLSAMLLLETAIKRLPLPWRSRSGLLRALIGIRMSAIKA